MQIRARPWRYLELLQEATYARLGLTPTRYDATWLERLRESMVNHHQIFQQVFGDEDAATKARLMQGWNRSAAHLSDKAFSDMAAALADIPTPYENPVLYRILQRLQKEMDAIIKLMPSTTAAAANRRFFVGTLPTGQVNARAIAVPNSDDYLIVFDTQIFNFVNLLAKAVASAALPVQHNGVASMSLSSDDVERRIREDPDVLARFEEVVCMYLVTGFVGAAAPYSLEPPFASMAAELVDSTELFIMGHEYGHVISGHFAREQRTLRSALPEQDAQEFATDWNDEFVADNRGVELASAALQVRGGHIARSFMGADFFFICTLLIERAASVLTTGEDLSTENMDETTSHPPAGLRLAMLHRGLQNALPPELYSAVKNVRDVLLGVVEILWRSSAYPALKNMHGQGVRPSQVWVELARQHHGTP